jgi:hypothetical protein
MSKPKDLRGLIDLTKSTQALLAHFQSSLAPSAPAPATATAPQPANADLPNPLEAVKASTTLLKSYTTTLSLLLLTPPFTPSALISKITDVSSSALSGMVAAATYIPQPGQKDVLGSTMRTELRAQVRRLLGTWGDVLALVLRMAEMRQTATGKDEGPTESEKQDVLSSTGVLWDSCDVLLKVCTNGVVGLVMKKAQELRAVLLDAIEELKEWGEDVDDDDDDDEAEGSDDEFADEDDIFGASNKLGKDDKALKELLDVSVKKLKMVGMLYQALAKRRLKTFPSETPGTSEDSDANVNALKKLDELMDLLKQLPETVDDLASAFYDLDEAEAKTTLEKCSSEAKKAAELVKQSWSGSDDEFTAWSEKWVSAFDAV